jgi:hypothetical protein
MQWKEGDAMKDQEEQKEMWALVELFGHQRIAGKITQAELGSGELIRVDVPAVRDRAALTKFYNVKAIYGITPVDEATATRIAGDIHAAPVSEWVLDAELDRRKNQLSRGEDFGREEVSLA